MSFAIQRLPCPSNASPDVPRLAYVNVTAGVGLPVLPSCPLANSTIDTGPLTMVATHRLPPPSKATNPDGPLSVTAGMGLPLAVS